MRSISFWSFLVISDSLFAVFDLRISVRFTSIFSLDESIAQENTPFIAFLYCVCARLRAEKTPFVLESSHSIQALFSASLAFAFMFAFVSVIADFVSSLYLGAGIFIFQISQLFQGSIGAEQLF